MLTISHQLSKATLDALDVLSRACQTTDNAIMPLYPHLLKCYRPGPGSFLYHKNEQLIAFLGCFHFNKESAEVALLVHPSHRRKGLASAIWASMCSQIHLFRPTLTHFLISAPKDLNRPWMHAHACQFEATEYDMSCNAYRPEFCQHQNLQIRQATHKDIQSLNAIDDACFYIERTGSNERIEKLLKSPHVKIFLLSYQKHPIGQVYLRFEKKHIRLTDFAILPHMQHQGFGTYLIKYCLKLAYTHHQQPIILNVAAKNQSALTLYQHAGFQIYNAIDYYKRRFSLDSF